MDLLTFLSFQKTYFFFTPLHWSTVNQNYTCLTRIEYNKMLKIRNHVLFIFVSVVLTGPATTATTSCPFIKYLLCASHYGRDFLYIILLTHKNPVTLRKFNKIGILYLCWIMRNFTDPVYKALYIGLLWEIIQTKLGTRRLKIGKCPDF